jgi:hypothetical protein
MKRNIKSIEAEPRALSVASVAIILLHPVAAVGLLFWFISQHRWRQRGRGLKGSERELGVQSHIRAGNQLFIFAWLVTGLAFLVEIYLVKKVNASIFDALPSTLHGATGPIGMAMLTMLWIWGRRSRDLKAAGEPFAAERNRHGRASDFILALAGLHAFLGFLGLLSRL